MVELDLNFFSLFLCGYFFRHVFLFNNLRIPGLFHIYGFASTKVSVDPTLHKTKISLFLGAKKKKAQSQKSPLATCSHHLFFRFFFFRENEMPSFSSFFCTDPSHKSISLLFCIQHRRFPHGQGDKSRKKDAKRASWNCSFCWNCENGRILKERKKKSAIPDSPRFPA